jgi:putative ABC transport system permease protein
VQLRRAAIDAAVLIAAAGALVALHQRGIGTGPDSGAGLPAGAPTLGVVAGTLLLLRLMPGGTRLALRQSLRSRRPLAVFGAARAAATSTRVLPLLALVTTAALASFAGTLAATTSQGLDDGSWNTVGADARFDVGPESLASTAEVATRIAAAPGVDQVVAGQVIDSARVIADNVAVTPGLVIVDAAAFRKLLASTPLPQAPDLDQLTRPGSGLPALVLSSDGSLRPGMAMRLLRQGQKALELTAVGTAPAVDDAADVIVVDTATAAAAGLTAEPDTIWATGPGAERAVKAAGVNGHAVLRTEVLRDRRTAPLTSGLVMLDRGAAVALLVLGLLGFALGAAASAPARWETLARLRTLGLRSRDAHRVAAGELLPPVLAAAVCGPLLGVLLVRLTFGPLSLRLLTGQSGDPATAVPWWLLGVVPVALLATLVAVVAVVAAEAAVRRRRRLADVLRVGG